MWECAAIMYHVWAYQEIWAGQWIFYIWLVVSQVCSSWMVHRCCGNLACGEAIGQKYGSKYLVLRMNDALVIALDSTNLFVFQSTQRASLEKSGKAMKEDASVIRHRSEMEHIHRFIWIPGREMLGRAKNKRKIALWKLRWDYPSATENCLGQRKL